MAPPAAEPIAVPASVLLDQDLATEEKTVVSVVRRSSPSVALVATVWMATATPPVLSSRLLSGVGSGHSGYPSDDTARNWWP
jgi:hypothetical protein